MGKSSKKSATKVDAAPVAVAAPTKPLKKGKRDAEEIIEKQTNAKKQKKDIEEAIQKKKAEVKKTVKKAVETSSSSEEDSSSSDSEAEQKVKVPAKKGAVPAKKLPVAAAKNGIAKKGKASSSSDESDSSDDSESDDELPKTKATAAKNGPAATVKKDKSSDESDSEAETSSDEDVTVAKKKPTAAAKNVPAPAAKKEDDSSDESDSEDETSSDEDVTAAKKPTAAAKNVPAPAAKKKDDSSDESDSEDETSSDEDVTAAKKDTDVDMVDAESTKTNAGSLSEKKAPKTPVTPKVQASGSKTLFVGNLAYSVEQADVEEFFKDAGKIVEVRFASHPDGSFKGFGHVEFETAEEAQKALQLNGQQLLGRDVRLDLAMERGAYTPQSGNDRSSNQKGERGQGPTIFVRGFGTNDEEEKIRNALNEHFGSCGDITRVSIPKDQEGGIKGVAFIDFKDSDSLNQALELDNSELGGSTLTVEEARPRGEGRDSAGGGGRGGRGGRGGGWSGGRGGRDSGGRFGGRRGGGGRGGGGRFGGGGRGRGTPSKPFGKKTTFDD